MITSSLDQICRSILLRKRYSLHWYVDFLISARDALRELFLDDLQVINTVKAAVDEFGCVDIPDGAASIVGVGVASGQVLVALTPSNSINSLQNLNDTFHVERYDESNASDSPPLIYGYFPNSWNIQYGGYTDTYKVIKERNQIQLNEALDVDDVFVTYVGDGRNANAATHVDVEAEATIEAYILWQLKENSRSYGDGESERMRQLYLNQRTILRARKSDITIPVLRRIDQRNTRRYK